MLWPESYSRRPGRIGRSRWYYCGPIHWRAGHSTNIKNVSYRWSIHRRYCRTCTSPRKIQFHEDLVHPTRTTRSQLSGPHPISDIIPGLFCCKSRHLWHCCHQECVLWRWGSHSRMWRLGQGSQMYQPQWVWPRILLGLANWDFHKASKKHKNASYWG